MDDTTVISIFMALEGMHAYSAFLPSIMTIGTFVDSPEKVRMIREGEIVATAFLLALGVTVASITKSALPLVLAIGSGLVTLGVYEYALRKAPVHTTSAHSAYEDSEE